TLRGPRGRSLAQRPRRGQDRLATVARDAMDGAIATDITDRATGVLISTTDNVLEEGEPWGLAALGFALFEDDLVDGDHNPKGGGPLAIARVPPPLGLTILALFEGLVAVRRNLNHHVPQ
ncbi:MAG: hypothetical protein PUF37_05640, partial [Prevotellaceae bacterium]|nr:hypothetical protein [Prevotellaceae bacterium]